MQRPQSQPRQRQPQAVLNPLTEAAVFLVVTIDEGAEQVVHDLLADLSGIVRAVGFRVPKGGLTCVTGIGSRAWDRLFSGNRPAELHEFTELDGPRHRAPATPGDLLFHIRAGAMDLCFELASQIMDRLRGAVTVQDEVHGFRYFEKRDLLGFVDGTENPAGLAAERAALVPEEDDPEFAGGSYVIVQKYLHDLQAWNALPVEAQELVIGRRKLSDIELSDEAKPADSHVAANTVNDADGEQQQILRDNMPFGSVGAGEFGTYFIGYCHTPETTEQMLRNMFLGTAASAGRHDRILDFSTAVTGCLFYSPTSDFLDDPPDLPAASGASEASGASGASAVAADAAAVPEPAVPLPSAALTDLTPRDPFGSLGIGGLKETP
ncbi:Dyp-type peroxidase [Actinomadura rupiterrae]|uniref:Dyp-type peroxidase n=1 Tax=Actinomadura rupiterrae TaxID=559627 RepID=UPI0020A48FC1|nr:Dyp-type peroxidase [Actinomadura rupiterrae]MCP2341836.1 putative iron-dependent peroxidase [Actinomadura rupiterrae]